MESEATPKTPRPDKVTLSPFGCATCLWAGVECTNGELYEPADDWPYMGRLVPTCAKYVWYD